MTCSHEPIYTRRKLSHAIASLNQWALRTYRERLREFLERIEAFCRARELGYHRVVTDTPVEQFVLAQLKGLVLA